MLLWMITDIRRVSRNAVRAMAIARCLEKTGYLDRTAIKELLLAYPVRSPTAAVGGLRRTENDDDQSHG